MKGTFFELSRGLISCMKLNEQTWPKNVLGVILRPTNTYENE
jgi:hypothetical protein